MAAAAVVVLVVEEPPAHVDQGVGTSLRRCAGGFAVDIASGGQPQGGVDHGTPLGVEAAGELAAPVEDPRQVQPPLELGRVGVVAH